MRLIYSGTLAPYQDIDLLLDAFARALLRLAGNPALARKLGDSARIDVEESYSWQQSADTLQGIYEQVTLRHKGLGTPERI